MTTVEHKQILHRYVDSVNRGKLDIINNEVLDRNFVYHGIGEESQLSKEEYLNFLHEVRQAFPDFNVCIDELVAEDERVAYRMTVSGTHKGEFKGIAPTGKKFTVSTMGIVLFKNGKIAEEWEIYDAMGVLVQLGALAT
ncbi:MAG: ester cyclase [Candidatus Caldarchaeales archaeon]|jgi:steroid delta-isomerase-like uncharacterized protein|nr:ester cyclase [Candidatus Caldarchaeales archaeon]